MDGLIFIALICIIGGPILLVVALISAFGAGSRVAAVERQMVALKRDNETFQKAVVTLQQGLTSVIDEMRRSTATGAPTETQPQSQNPPPPPAEGMPQSPVEPSDVPKAAASDEPVVESGPLPDGIAAQVVAGDDTESATLSGLAIPPPAPSPPPLVEVAKPHAVKSFEESIGTRWTVWIGGLALAFGGIFLVKYSIDEGYFTPPFRTALGALFALLLTALGEYARRRGQDAANGTPIPAILTAAGTLAAYATVFAAYALYHLIGDGTAFILLGLVAVATMLAALLHGPWIATLGILGATATPVLIDAKTPDFTALVVYLLAVTLAGFGIARVRRWRFVALAALVPAIGWGLLLDLALPRAHDAIAVAGYTLGLFGLIVGFLVVGMEDALDPPADRPFSLLGLGGVKSVGLLTLLLLWGDHYAPASLTVASLFVVTMLGLAWRYPAMSAGCSSAGLFTVVALGSWTIALPATLDTGVMVQSLDGIVRIRPNLVAEFAGFAAIAAGFFLGVGSLGAARATPQAYRTGGWLAAGAAFTPLMILIVAWLRIAGWAPSPLFAGLALALAAALGALTSNLILRERLDQPALSVAVAAVGTIAALGAALTIALERGALTIALALVVAAIATVHASRPIAVLRPVAALIGAIVLARVLYDPRIVGDQLGETPIVNWLLYGYGVPTLAFGYAARACRRQLGAKASSDVSTGVLEALTIVFAGFLCVFELHHAMHLGNLLDRSADAAELGLIATMGLVGTLALTRLARRTGLAVFEGGSLVVAVLTVLVVLGLLTVQNPAFSNETIGNNLIFNDLLPGYLVPALAAALAAWAIRRGPNDARANALAVVAVALSFTYVTLQTRHIYQGTEIGIFGSFFTIMPHTSDAEIWTYSVVWLVYAIATLAIGGIAHSPFARAIAAVIIVLTVAKVFLYDMSALTGIYRALSFIGLGAVLIAIGFVYQKWLFKRPSPGGGA